jgi:hypothetical protein
MEPFAMNNTAHPFARPLAQRAGLAGLVLIGLLSSAGPALAQASPAYRLTLLNRPAKVASGHLIYANQVDPDGTVHGGMRILARQVFNFKTFKVDSLYQVQAVDWKLGTASSATPVAGSRFFLPSLRNAAGQMIGFRDTSVATEGAFSWGDIYPGVGATTASTLVRRTGGVDEPAPSAQFVARDMNDAGVVVGTTLDTTYGHAMLWQGHSLQPLPMPEGAFSATGESLNNKGLVVGSTIYKKFFSPTAPANSTHYRGVGRAAIWKDGQLIWEAADEGFNGSRAVRVNANDEVLITGTNKAGFHAEVWKDGQLRPAIVAGERGLTGWADMNDQGVIAGCYQPSADSPMSPFVLQAGVFTDLNELATQQKLPLPAGQRLDCQRGPFMGKQGSLILSYSPSASTDPSTSPTGWAVLTPQP